MFETAFNIKHEQSTSISILGIYNQNIYVYVFAVGHHIGGSVAHRLMSSLLVADSNRKVNLGEHIKELLSMIRGFIKMA